MSGHPPLGSSNQMMSSDHLFNTLDYAAMIEPQSFRAASETAIKQNIVKLSPTLSVNELTRNRSHLPIVGWDDIVNIGDQIVLDITDRVFRYRPRRVAGNVEHMLGVGSLFFMASKNSHIWGSGILTCDEPIPEIRSDRIRALRGTRTADRLVKEGYRLPDVPFGDPGMFVSEYVPDRELNQEAGVSKIVVIPHHSTYTIWANGHFSCSTEVEILDPCTSRMSFLRKIRQAEIVISESLHGLIFATAFRKKAVWIGDVDSDLFKYHDWFSMIDCPPLKPLDPHNDVGQLVRAARIFDHNICMEDLRRSFPHEVAIGPDDKRIGYKSARDHRPFCFFFQVQQWPFLGGRLSATQCFDLAASAADIIFDCWDDRPYALGIAHHLGILPNKQQLDRIVYEMDHNLHHDFAVVASIQQVIQAGLEMHLLASDLSWAYGNIGESSTVIIRPSGRRRGDNYVVFCI